MLLNEPMYHLLPLKWMTKKAVKVANQFVMFMQVALYNILNSRFTNELEGMTEKIVKGLQSKLTSYLHIDHSFLKENAALFDGIQVSF
ncbi:hypothetical protein [Bacillus sp. NPDC077027]|uniref:hypothetical protein n=1 Tax=Bacillus sp. NPDC077027 TaxID=3390548 RepID=UPI003CFE5426